MFDAPQSWKMQEPEKVLQILREVQCWRLGHWNGCCCSAFSLRNVDISITCATHGEQAVRVSSAAYADQSLLDPILAEVHRQMVDQAFQPNRWVQYIGSTRVTI